MKILVNGACGRLGSELCRVLEGGYRDYQLVGAADPRAAPGSGVVRQLADFVGEADAVVDFSHHTATGSLCAFCEERRLPLVVATTGQTRAEKARIEQAAVQLPVFWAANLSLGVALLTELAQTAAATLPDTDIEIIELHHDRKQDAPSGTALELAHAIAQVRPGSFPVCGRHGAGRRRPGEIGIHAVRLGNLVGTHSVLLSSDEQTIAITHEAHTPRIYVLGALLAARFVAGCGPGLYAMPQLVAQRRRVQEAAAHKEGIVHEEAIAHEAAVVHEAVVPHEAAIVHEEAIACEAAKKEDTV